ncbi:MAG: hypothetical protein FWG73_09380 [Planctomycetaceae bacterium]|nr:hypothetical protein [Planctomycetaceae bacterium]
MNGKIDNPVHELATLLATARDKDGSWMPVNKDLVKKVYGRYLLAMQMISELDKDEEFKKNPLPPSESGLV